jgi:hypothetical protein
MSQVLSDTKRQGAAGRISSSVQAETAVAAARRQAATESYKIAAAS